MASMAPSDGNYIDSYGHLLVNFGFIFTYLLSLSQKHKQIGNRKPLQFLRYFRGLAGKLRI
ncbi:hypothetical protein ALC53_08974 [Atta colombica]|uniref:Uncharacterized protein n=1 Tax=Atta colombica TaxID=520822 RepID=A0A151I1R7_9HYME|nr:hypothetical protein ALC53_08974 [Atta colombica]